jgi:DNA-binding protein HU-beta/integration host factor subunit beta
MNWAHRTSTRRDIEVAVAEKLGMRQERVADVLCEALNEIAAQVARGRRVEIRRWGVFEPKLLPDKRMRNIATGEVMVAESRKSVRFKPAAALVERVRGSRRSS